VRSARRSSREEIMSGSLTGISELSAAASYKRFDQEVQGPWTGFTHCGGQSIRYVDRQHFPCPTAVEGGQTEMETGQGWSGSWLLLLLLGNATNYVLVCSIIESAFKAIFHLPIVFDAELSDGGVHQVAREGDRVDCFFEGLHPHFMVLELVFPASDLLKMELEEPL